MKKFLSIILAVTLSSTLFVGCGEKKTVINVYNVGDYIDEEVISLFEKENPDIKVNYETYFTNEEMYIKVKNKSSAYDVVFPSDYMVERMASEGLLNKLNYDNIPNIKNIGKQYLNLDYDPNCEYTVPYMWGTMGILYNKDMVDEKDVKSGKAIYDKKYSGEIFMLDSERDAIGITMKMLGYSMNSKDDGELAEAKKSANCAKASCPGVLRRRGQGQDDCKRGRSHHCLVGRRFLLYGFERLACVQYPGGRLKPLV